MHPEHSYTWQKLPLSCLAPKSWCISPAALPGITWASQWGTAPSCLHPTLWGTAWHWVALTPPSSSLDPSAASKLPHSRGMAGRRMGWPFSPRAVQGPALFAWLQALDAQVSSSRSWLPEISLSHWEAQQARDWQSLQHGRVPLSRCRNVTGCPHAWDPGRGFHCCFFQALLFHGDEKDSKAEQKGMGIRKNKRTNGSNASFTLLHEYIRLNCYEDSSICNLGYLKSLESSGNNNCSRQN